MSKVFALSAAMHNYSNNGAYYSYEMPHFETQIEHIVVRQVRTLRPMPCRLILAISGGLDSIVLGEILSRWARGLHLELLVAYVHHGRAPLVQSKGGGKSGNAMGQYRLEAQAFVRQWAEARQLPFVSNPAEAVDLHSEAELRQYRNHWLTLWRQEFKADAVVLAHHRDDLIETQVMRLIRGSGRQGLQAMRVWRRRRLRPMLSLSREQIEKYASLRQLTWLEDPSNQELHPLRNWLREEWLPLLEKKQPGAQNALARSLGLLSSVKSTHLSFGNYVGLRREQLARVSSLQQEALLAGYFRSMGLKNYARTHVREILKRLGTGSSASKRETFTFEMLGCEWTVTPDLLWASRV